MKINRTAAITVSIALILIWAGNIYFYNMHKLNGPLFMTHFYEIKDQNQFSLFYVDNLNSNENINYISLPEAGLDCVTIQVNDTSSDGRYYKMKRILVDLSRSPAPNGQSIGDYISSRDIHITKVVAHTSKGSAIEADIGSIYITGGKKTDRRLSAHSSRSSSDFTGEVDFAVDDVYDINRLESKLLETLSSSIDIRINDIPVDKVKFPYSVGPEDGLKVKYSLKSENPHNAGQSCFYNARLDFVGQDSRGGDLTASFTILHEPYGFRPADIRKLKSVKEAG